MAITTQSFIANQPVERHRFRYLKEGSHGILTGEEDTATSPQFVFEVTGASADYLKNRTIKCWCHLAASDDKGEDIKLSPHTLERKTAKRKRGNVLPNLQPIRMEAQPITINGKIRFEFNLHKYRIALANSDQYSKNLKEKYNHVQLGGNLKLQDLDARCDEENGQDKGQGNGKSEGQSKGRGKNFVHKAYLLFIVEHNLYDFISCYETHFSKSILNLDAICINSVMPTHVPVTSTDTGFDTNVQLLVGDVKLDYKLHISEIDPRTQARCWVRCVEDCTRIQGHKALNYVLPEFDCRNHSNDQRSPIECKMHLKHGRSKSNDVVIYYVRRSESVAEWLNTLEIPDESTLDEVFIGVTRDTNNYEDACQNLDGNRHQPNMLQDAGVKFTNIQTQPDSSYVLKKNVLMALESLDNGLRALVSKDSKQILQFICKVNKTYIRKHRSVNTLFHDAILTHNFCRADTILYISEDQEVLGRIHRYVGSMCNFHGQTLLHLACGRAADLIDALLDMWPPAVIVQDAEGETPLHAALKCPNAAAVVRKIVENEDFQRNEQLLTHLLKAYNTAGHTVLHSGIRGNHLALVEMLLLHCKKNDIDACAIRSLGTGESLMHFAVDIAEVDARQRMVDTILKHYPDAAKCVNYANCDAYGAYMGPTPATSESEGSDDVDVDSEDDQGHDISEAHA